MVTVPHLLFEEVSVSRVSTVALRTVSTWSVWFPSPLKVIQ